MAKLAIDRASIVFGKQKSGDFHSKSGDREIFIILSKIWRSPEKSGDLEALVQGCYSSINNSTHQNVLKSLEISQYNCTNAL